MRIDFSPLYRSTVGVDRLFSLLDTMGTPENGQPAYPPYNIERTAENAYRVTVAVAGFGESELSIELKDGTLTVKGEKKEAGGAREVLYRGIAGRPFERHFQLADHVFVTGATLENGLLHIDLERQVPEALKPRQIPIAVPAKAEAKVIEAAAA